MCIIQFELCLIVYWLIEYWDCILLQEALGDIVYAQLPEVETEYEQMGKFVYLIYMIV